MPINYGFFYDHIRRDPFPGILSNSQLAGCEAVIKEWTRRELTDLRWLAYILATAFHETARTMQPIAEFGKGRGHKYGEAVNGKVYYGRGLVQLTWDYNYQKMGDLLGIDLIEFPDKALEPATACAITFEGMIRGGFTGKKLADYFNEKTDWVGARRIINGLDQAEKIAGYAKAFFAALNTPDSKAEPPPVVPPVIMPTKPPVAPTLPPKPDIALPPPGVPARTDLAPTFWGRVKDLFVPRG